MTVLRLRGLGAFEVRLSTTTVTAFPTDKIRALLVYLTLEKKSAHRREMLAALFWPAIDSSLALNNLRVTLHRLRETLDKVQSGLGSALIESTRQTVQLNSALISSDVDTFQTLLAACATHAHTDLHQCVECRIRLAEAAARYQGELLAGFGLADAPAFEEWLLLRRESLHQQALTALHTLVQSFEAQGDDEQAHYYASRQLLLDPSREEAHRQLMRSLARRGLRTEALAQYETCRRLLREQLAVDPDPETLALVEQIRAGQLDTRQETRRHETRETRPVEEARMPSASPVSLSRVSVSPVSLSAQDWGEAPAVGKVYGRQAEVASVTGWLVRERCRVVALLGIGGLGKTTLAATVVRTVAPHFDRVLWRSLLNAPPLDELLRDILQRLADERLPDFPATLDAQLALLLDYLRSRRLLFVLDNLESILNPDRPGQMRAGYEGYAQLLRTVAERSHQSCLLLTSRERPQGLAQWAEDAPLVRILPLEGLTASAGQAMLTARGLSGPSADAAALVARYSGNPLALKLVAQTVQELFSGDIAAFLAVEAPIFDDIRLVLDQQFARLSPLEQELLLWLAVERAPVTAATLRANLVQPPLMPRFLEALRALQRRSLLETVGQDFTLQNVVIEYLTEQLVERICEEIDSELRITNYELRKASPNEEPVTRNSKLVNAFLNRHALLKAQATESIRQSQARLILQPVADRLVTQLGKARLATLIEQLLTRLRHTAPLAPGYAAGNLLNLLLAFASDVSGYDFSHLCVWQAYLPGAYLPRVKLTGADLTGAAFTHRIGAVQALQFGNDGELLVVGFREGLLGLWRARTGELVQSVTMDTNTHHSAVLHNSGRLLVQLTIDQTIDLVDVAENRVLYTLVGDASPIWRLIFSPDGRYVASGHGGGCICVWEVASGRLCAQWQAHAAPVTNLAFAPDNVRLASGAVDGTVALWHAPTAALLHALHGHTDEVPTLAFTPDGATLITGSHDLTVRLWATASGALRALLHGHTQLVRQVAVAPNGQWAASGGTDRFLYLWDLQREKVYHTLTDHAVSTIHLTFSPDSQTVASYDANETISVWAVASGQRLDAYRLHRAALYAVAFSPDGCRLVAGGADWVIYRWDVSQPAQPHFTARLAAHRYLVSTLAFSPDGATMASGDLGGGLRLWDSRTGASREWLGCQGAIKRIAFHPDGQTLATAGDAGLHLWSVRDGRQTHLLAGPTKAATACAFSPDGRWLAGSYADHTICLWAMASAAGPVLHHTLHHQTNLVQELKFSLDSRALFSSSYDNTLCRWDVPDGLLQARWSTAPTVYLALAIQPAGRLLAAAGGDHHIWLLDGETGVVCDVWHGHTNIIEAVSFSADGRLLASASQDETVRLWEVSSGACLQTLRTPGPYAGMNITGVTGISAAQKAALKALGAVEE